MAKHVISMTIHDVDHYSDEEKQAIIDSYPAHERDARSKGIPQLGSGRIYPISEKDIVIDPFEIPVHWYVIQALDFGWDHPTAAIQLCIDRDSDTYIVTKDYRKSEEIPLIHTAAIKPWGEYPCAWPADGLQTEKGSGKPLKNQYDDAGLDMMQTHATHPDGSNSVEAGLMQLLELMRTNRFKVFSTCVDWIEEFRMYHRKEGKIVKLMDDVMDATRYAYMMRRFAVPVMTDEFDYDEYFSDNRSDADEVTGY